MPVDAVDIKTKVRSDNSAVLELTLHDERLEERVQLLCSHGATRSGDTWHLVVDNADELAGITSQLFGLMADLLDPASTPRHTRQAAFDRDGNQCRLCGRDFDRDLTDDDVSRRVTDHMYPKHEAGPEHGVHESYNLVTVCRGCDDVFLQGDAFRFLPSRMKFTPAPLERQLLAWIQKRGITRSDWLRDKLTTAGGSQVGHELIAERLQMLTQMGVIRELGDVGREQDFDVFAVNRRHQAVGYTDKAAVSRHDLLTAHPRLDNFSNPTPIEMSERSDPHTQLNPRSEQYAPSMADGGEKDG